jgi:DNA-binding MarR family transcriptional regulator
MVTAAPRSENASLSEKASLSDNPLDEPPSPHDQNGPDVVAPCSAAIDAAVGPSTGWADLETVDALWLTPEQLRDWRSVVALLMMLSPALDAQLKRDSGLNNFEYHILASLSDAPTHALPMSDLAAIAQGSMSRLSHAVSRLEQAGWVERHACRDAGRRTAARLTPTGLRKIEEAAPGHVREVRRLVVDQLTPDQLQALGVAARAIVAGMDSPLAARLRSDLEPR